MADTKYKSTFTGVQVDNAVSTFVNTIGATASKTLQTSDYQAVLKSVDTAIISGDLLTIDGDGLIGDSGIAPSNVVVRDGTNPLTENRIMIAGTDGLIKQSQYLISEVEFTANKTTSITSESTDTQYPSAKAVYTAIGGAVPSFTEVEIEED